jgi:hypothetical protein
VRWLVVSLLLFPLVAPTPARAQRAPVQKSVAHDGKAYAIWSTEQRKKHRAGGFKLKKKTAGPQLHIRNL